MKLVARAISAPQVVDLLHNTMLRPAADLYKPSKMGVGARTFYTEAVLMNVVPLRYKAKPDTVSSGDSQ